MPAGERTHGFAASSPWSIGRTPSGRTRNLGAFVGGDVGSPGDWKGFTVGIDAWLAVLVPAVTLVVAFLAARRLDTEDPLRWPPDPKIAKAEGRLRLLPLLGLLLPVGVFFLALWLDAGQLIVWVSAAATIGLSLRVLDLSLHRRAARALVASFIPLAAVMPLVAGIPDRGGATVFHPSFLLLAAIVPAALLSRPLSKTWIPPVVTVCAAVPLVVWLALRSGPFQAPRPTEVATWLSRFDRPVQDMLPWDTFGRAAAWLQNTRGLTLDLHVPEKVLRDALLKGENVHPKVLAAALEARMLQSSDLGHFFGTDTLRRARALLTDEGPIVLTAQTPADVRLLVALGDVRGEPRERLIARLAKAWPLEAKGNRLEDASNLCRLFDLLDAKALIREQRPFLWPLLERTWCTQAPNYSSPGGFTPNEDGGVHPSEAPATWHALEIMSGAGVPPSIDLARTRRYVRGAIPRRTPLDRLDATYSDEQITWMRYEAEHDPTPSAARRLADAGPLLATGAFLLFSVYLLLRSRSVRVLPPEPPKLPLWAATPEQEADKDRPL